MYIQHHLVGRLLVQELHQHEDQNGYVGGDSRFLIGLIRNKRTLDVLNKYLKALTINYIHTYIHT
jgi:hypothetical protein